MTLLNAIDFAFIHNYVVKECERGNKIAAIRNLRDYASKYMGISVGLKDAKEWVEDLQTPSHGAWYAAETRYYDYERAREERSALNKAIEVARRNNDWALVSSLEILRDKIS